MYETSRLTVNRVCIITLLFGKTRETVKKRKDIRSFSSVGTSSSGGTREKIRAGLTRRAGSVGSLEGSSGQVQREH